MHEHHIVVVLQQMLMWYIVEGFRNVQETVSTFAVIYNGKENIKSRYWQAKNWLEEELC